MFKIFTKNHIAKFTTYNINNTIKSMSNESKFDSYAGYWHGPYGILVSNKVDNVCAGDGGNIRYRNGQETERDISNPMNESDYKKMYATYNENNGKWYHNKNNGKWYHNKNNK